MRSAEPRSQPLLLPLLLPLLCLAAALLLVASPARAWTEAAVRSVQAEIELAPDASAEVRMRARVRVHGGWLEGLELAGLDPDLELLPVDPEGGEGEGEGGERSSLIRVLGESGERYFPIVEQRPGGRIQLRFRRNETPRRGSLSLELRYRTLLAHRATEPRPGGQVRVRWTLPGWRTGLDGVELRVRAPAGARFAPPEGDREPEMQRHSEVEGGRALLSWRRAHVPRTLPWTIAFDVPEEALAPSLRGPRAEAAPPAPSPPSSGPRPEDPRGAPLFWWLLSLGLAGLAWAKRATLRREAKRARYSLRMMAPMRERWRSPASWLLALGAGYVGPLYPPFAWALLGLLVLLSLPRREDRSRAPSPGSFRYAGRDWIEAARARARWAALGPSAWLDLATLPGAALLLALLSTPAWLPSLLSIQEPAYGRWIAAALLPLPLFCSGGRLARPEEPLAQLGLLLGTLRRLRVPPRWPFALRPVLHVDLEGEVQEARVELHAEAWVEGLLRAALVRASRAEPGAERRGLMLLLVTRAQSRAEATLEALAEDLPTLRSEGGRRIARLLPFTPEQALSLLAPLTEAGPLPAAAVDDPTVEEPPPLLAHNAATSLVTTGF